MKLDQLDLFRWADERPAATVISAIPGIVKRIYRERGKQLPNWAGSVVSMPPRHPEERKSA